MIIRSICCEMSQLFSHKYNWLKPINISCFPFDASHSINIQLATNNRGTIVELFHFC